MWGWFVLLGSNILYLYSILLETPSVDEVEVYQAIQNCLELRKSYIFREAVAPWETEVISDPSTPKPIQNPFDYTQEGKSDVSLSKFLIRLNFCTWFHYLIYIMNQLNCDVYYQCFNNLNSNPLQHHFQMEDGVVHVYANKDCKIFIYK